VRIAWRRNECYGDIDEIKKVSSVVSVAPLNGTKVRKGMRLFISRRISTCASGARPFDYRAERVLVLSLCVLRPVVVPKTAFHRPKNVERWLAHCWSPAVRVVVAVSVR